MTANPYQSPNLTARELNASEAPPNQHGPVVMAFLGCGAGGFIGGTAGALSSGALGFIAGIQDVDSLAITFFGAILGFFLGAAGGAVLGLVLGIVAGCATSRIRKGLVTTSTILAALIGIAGGFLGGVIVSDEAPISYWPPVLIGVGVCVGCIGGIKGGSILGRWLGNLAWGPPKKGEKQGVTEPAATA